jgi:flagellar FliJ protein
MFRYRLAGIMRLKEYKEKLCRDEMGKGMTALSQAIEKETALKDEIFLFNNEIRSSRQGIIDVNRLALGDNYLRYLKARLARQREVVAQRQTEVEEARRRLFEAMKERKVLEKLKDKKYAQYQYEQNRLEQAMLDDLAAKKVEG